MPLHTAKTDQTASQHQKIQRQTDAADKRKAKNNGHTDDQQPMQAGARRYPEPPFPQQHLIKPGREADLDPAPLYDAPYYKGSEKLKDKVAVITGGDSGIGRAVAVLYAREGADVAIIYLNEHEDAEVTRRAVEAEGARCLLIPGDVSSRVFCRDAIERIVEELDGLDILVNNAAFQLHTRKFEDLTEEQFDLTMKTNLYGYFHMSQAAVEHMQPGSAIINTGSVTGLEGSKNLLDYAMTKGGIHAFTRSLSSHLMARGIRVNAVAPRTAQDFLQISRPGSKSRLGLRRH